MKMKPHSRVLYAADAGRNDRVRQPLARHLPVLLLLMLTVSVLVAGCGRAAFPVEAGATRAPLEASPTIMPPTPTVPAAQAAADAEVLVSQLERPVAAELTERFDPAVAGTAGSLTGAAPISNPVMLTETTVITAAVVPSAGLTFTHSTPISATRAISPPGPGTTPLAGGTVLDPAGSAPSDARLSPVATPTAGSRSLLPTPTPRPTIQPAPTAGPTPDGVARTVQLPILMYHYLSVPPAGADIYRQDLSVAPELFAAQLDALQAAGYSTISLYDLMANLTGGAPLPDKPVIITFDDGYRDNYENALPLLAERGMTAMFFVVTDFMDEERPEYLTWDMARAMRDAGMFIESHGRNHVSLAGKNPDYLVWQALGSLETIEYEMGVRPRFVSYPAGEYDELTKEIFHSAGYWAGLTTAQGATHSSEADLFELKRVRVRGTTTPEELIRLAGLNW
jgi:peptidoglycan/xylan/chitin deacetylase (PgdA/CDA1 family)